MSPKVQHMLLEVGTTCTLAAALITAQPALNIAKCVPTACAGLTVLGLICKSLVVGNIPPSNSP